MGRTKEEVVKDFRTGEIVQAARRVIGELGFADASMERIAQEAGARSLGIWSKVSAAAEFIDNGRSAEAKAYLEAAAVHRRDGWQESARGAG